MSSWRLTFQLNAWLNYLGEFIKPGGGARCVNVRSGHDTKGHQLKNGKVLAVGNYVSRFSFEGYQETFQFDVFSRLNECLKLLYSQVQRAGESEAEAAAQLHRNTVMAHFYNHAEQAKTDSGASAVPFISQSTCVSCLIEPPEHALPCGHILCSSCLRAYGHSKSKNVVEIDGCPIESLSLPRYWKVFLKPADAGIRILTLDGYVTAFTAESLNIMTDCLLQAEVFEVSLSLKY